VIFHIISKMGAKLFSLAYLCEIIQEQWQVTITVKTIIKTTGYLVSTIDPMNAIEELIKKKPNLFSNVRLGFCINDICILKMAGGGSLFNGERVRSKTFINDA